MHGPFEGDLVRRGVDPAAVRAAMAPLADTGPDIARWTAVYLAATVAQVVPFYDMQKVGGLAQGDPRGVAFATVRLAAGASALRDLTTAAWHVSAGSHIGWPAVAVADVEAGKVDPFDSLFGAD